MQQFLTAEQFRPYVADPVRMDKHVREWCKIPEDKYFAVATWPDKVAGMVTIVANSSRQVANVKISKSHGQS